MTKEIILPSKHVVFVDDEDHEYLMQWRWYYANGYARHIPTSKNPDGSYKKKFFMHTVLMRPAEGFFVDHINLNKLDNRRQNLRLCTKCQNGWNSRKQANSLQPHKGVYRNYNRWVAHISIDNKSKHLGTFATPEEAAKAHNEAALKYRGEFAYLNSV